MTRTLISASHLEEGDDGSLSGCGGAFSSSLARRRSTEPSCCSDPIVAPNVIEAIGKVVATGDGYVTVETMRAIACSSCEMSASCGTAVLSKLIGGAETRITLPSETLRQIGENVVILVPESGLLIGAAMAYILPIVTLILAVLIVAGFGVNELIMLGAAGVGLMAGLYLSHILSHSAALMNRLVPLQIKA